jgi:hypothetical protein
MHHADLVRLADQLRMDFTHTTMSICVINAVEGVSEAVAFISDILLVRHTELAISQVSTGLVLSRRPIKRIRSSSSGLQFEIEACATKPGAPDGGT